MELVARQAKLAATGVFTQSGAVGSQYLEQVLELVGSHIQSFLICCNCIKGLHQCNQPGCQADQVCMRTTKALADVSTHDAKNCRLRDEHKARQRRKRGNARRVMFQTRQPCLQCKITRCRWIINETFARQSTACTSEMGIVYLPSAAYPDVKHV